MSRLTGGPIRTPDRSSPMPLWAQVLDDVRARLTRGDFRSGFPPERELTEQYGISRHTMRDVMRRLHADGLIDRERGRGTFLRSGSLEQRTGALYSLFRSIEDQGFEQRSKVLVLDQRKDATAAAHLGLPDTTAFVYLHRLRKADATPIAIDELWLPVQIARPLLTVDFEHTAVYAELEQRCGVRPGAGWERVYPVVPIADERRALDMPRDAAAFLVERFTSHEGRPLEWRRTIIRGDLYTFLTTWDATGAQLDRPAFSPTDR